MERDLDVAAGDLAAQMIVAAWTGFSLAGAALFEDEGANLTTHYAFKTRLFLDRPTDVPRELVVAAEIGSEIARHPRGYGYEKVCEKGYAEELQERFEEDFPNGRINYLDDLEEDIKYARRIIVDNYDQHRQLAKYLREHRKTPNVTADLAIDKEYGDKSRNVAFINKFVSAFGQ